MEEVTGVPLVLIGLLILVSAPLTALGGGFGLGSAVIVMLVGAGMAGAGGFLFYMDYVAGERAPVDAPPWDPD